MTTDSMIDYEALAQDAMRSVVRTVLTSVAATGRLPGDHHFYISFDTHAAGVSLSRRLKEKYANEMTIVLQHRFWDLSVQEDRFEVKLTFDGIPERLVVPFKAIKVFFDPSVRYGLQFEEPEFTSEKVDESVASLETNGLGADDMASDDIDATGAHPRPAAARSTSPRKARTPRKRSEPREITTNGAAAHNGASEPQTANEDGAANQDQASDNTNVKHDAAEDPETAGAKVVSLDAFRKK